MKKKVKLAIAVALMFSMLTMIQHFIGIKQSEEPSPQYQNVEPLELSFYHPYRRFYFNNINIAKAAISLAVMDTTAGTEKLWFTRWGISDVVAYIGVPGYCPETFVNIAPKLVIELNNISYTEHNTSRWCYPSYCLYASCDFNVAMAVWWSGADDNFPACLGGRGEFNPKHTYAQTGYLVHNFSNGKWVQVEPGSKVLPGDIALGRDEDGIIGHVWMYVATWENGRWIDNSLVQERFPNSTANRYEGSYESYYAKLGYDANPWLSSAYIFRFTGDINDNSKFKLVTFP